MKRLLILLYGIISFLAGVPFLVAGSMWYEINSAFWAGSGMARELNRKFEREANERKY
jgi:hypothetical protein